MKMVLFLIIMLLLAMICPGSLSASAGMPIVVLFGRPGCGKTTTANEVLRRFPDCLGVDLDICITEEMKANFAQGVYPTIEERAKFMHSACNYLAEQIASSSMKRCLVSFSFVNEDLRRIFRDKFHQANWLLLNTPDDEAESRIEKREGHFYKVYPRVEGKQGNEWNFDPVLFDHTVLNGMDSVQINAKKIVDALKSCAAQHTAQQRHIEPKLYFRYGVVSSAKTLNLLAVAYTYKSQGKKVLLLKPDIDVRFGTSLIKSKAGIEQTADFIITQNFSIFDIPADKRNVQCILVDEAQFLQPAHVEELRSITSKWNVPVICYGLRTDFRTRLFPGSKRLLELADSIEEVKTTCHYCDRKAVFNLKHVNGRADISGPTIQLGCEERYFPTCSECYNSAIESVVE